MSNLLAIDPDPHGGSWVMLDEADGRVVRRRHQDNLGAIRALVSNGEHGIYNVACEGVQSFGMPVGASVFETVKNIGEIRGYCKRRLAVKFDDSLTRPKIKAALCHSAKASDANVRQALLDLYPATGGGKTPQVGTKSQPGPLYGMKSDLWSALALGVVWLSLRGKGPLAERDQPTAELVRA